MLKLQINGKMGINPNEEIRRQFIEIIENFDDDTDDINELKNIISTLKLINPHQYRYTIQLIYQEVYCYFSYVKNNGETNKSFFEDFSQYLCAADEEEIIEFYENDEQFYLNQFKYILKLNNLFKIRMLLNLNNMQKEFLMGVTDSYLYDEVALSEYLGIESLEDYYFWRIDDDTIVEEVVEDIISFLNYVYNANIEIYKKYIYDILNRVYKWSRYYVEHSIEIEENDLEVKVVRLINNHQIDYICEYIKNDEDILSELLTRIFADMDYGYSTILTKNGIEDINDEKLDNYIKLIKRKSPK